MLPDFIGRKAKGDPNEELMLGTWMRKSDPLTSDRHTASGDCTLVAEFVAPVLDKVEKLA
jgi:hypothetical protein